MDGTDLNPQKRQALVDPGKIFHIA